MTCKIVIAFIQDDWSPDDLRHIAGYGKFGMNIICEDENVMDRISSVPDTARVVEVITDYDLEADSGRSIGDPFAEGSRAWREAREAEQVQRAAGIT